MKKAFLNRLLAGCACLSAVMALTACGTPPPSDYGGKWTPVNRFQNTPTEIPLSPSYVFQAAPMDETLRTMLRRWAVDVGLTVSWRLRSDYTLFTPVTKIRTPDLQTALAQLSSIYAAQDISVTTDGKQILVQSAAAQAMAPTPHAQPASTEPAPNEEPASTHPVRSPAPQPEPQAVSAQPARAE